MDHCRGEMPHLFGKTNKQKELIKNLPSIAEGISKKKGLPLGDFPNLGQLGKRLEKMSFSELEKIGWNIVVWGCPYSRKLCVCPFGISRRRVNIFWGREDLP